MTIPTLATTLLRYEPTTSDQRIRNTRRAIAEAATQAFHSHGYARTTMSSVAVIAGVAPRTLYRHYRSKSALFAATVALGTSDFLEKFAQYAPQLSVHDALVSAFLETAPDPTPECRQLVALVCSEEEVWQYWLASSYRLQPYLATILRAAASGELVARAPEHTRETDSMWLARAGCVLTAINTAYQLWATSDPGVSLAAVVTETISVIEPALGMPDRSSNQTTRN